MRCKNQGRSVAPVPAQEAGLLISEQRLRRRGHQLGLHGQSAGGIQARGNGCHMRGVRALADPLCGMLANSGTAMTAQMIIMC